MKLDYYLEFLKDYPAVKEIVKLIIMAIVAVIFVKVFLRLERKASGKWIQKTNNDINIRFVERIGRFIVIFLVAEWVIMSSSITNPFGKVLFQGTTVLAAIAGFAAQPVIADMICGMMISMTKPFNIGDRIELEDGSAGIVKDITLRHVVLQDIDTVIRIVPNSKLNGMKINNMSFHTSVRSVHMRFNVAYETDVDKAMRVIGRAIEESPHTIPGKPGADGNKYGPVYYIQYAESSLIMAVTVYYEPTTPTEVVKSDINSRVKKALESAGIEIPYNYVNVVINEH